MFMFFIQRQHLRFTSYQHDIVLSAPLVAVVLLYQHTGSNDQTNLSPPGQLLIVVVFKTNKDDWHLVIGRLCCCGEVALEGR